MTTTIEDFMGNVTDEQQQLLFKISDTAEQEYKYAEEIKRKS